VDGWPGEKGPKIVYYTTGVKWEDWAADSFSFSGRMGKKRKRLVIKPLFSGEY
jgi:hypothetical protein